VGTFMDEVGSCHLGNNDPESDGPECPLWEGEGRAEHHGRVLFVGCLGFFSTLAEDKPTAILLNGFPSYFDVHTNLQPVIIARRSFSVKDNMVSEEISRLLSSVLLDVDDPNILRVNQTLGFAAYIARQAGLEKDAIRILGLRRRSLTSLVSPLHPMERSLWAKDLNELSRSIHRGSIEIGPEEDHRKRKKELREARGWDSKLKLAAQMVLNPMPTRVATPERATTIDTEEEKEKQWEPILASGRFDSRTLPDDEPFGFIRCPVILVGGKLRASEKVLLAKLGVSFETMFRYNILHNCRLIGVRADVLPGRADAAYRVASEIFLKEAKPVILEQYRISPTLPRKVRDNHAFWPLLPKAIQTRIESWDFLTEAN